MTEPSAPSRDELAALLRDVADAFRVWWPEYLHDIGQEKAGALHDAIAALRRERRRGEDVVALRMALNAMAHISEDGRMPTVYMLEGMADGMAAEWRPRNGAPGHWDAFADVVERAAAELVCELAAEPEAEPTQ